MLTKKKRLYAEARESGKNQKDSAIFAGCPENSAKGSGSRYEKDPDVKKYREKLKSVSAKNIDSHISSESGIGQAETPAGHELPAIGIAVDPKMENEGAAILILRSQLHSDDERIAQGAAKALLDYEIKKGAVIGKKQQKVNAAKDALTGRFRPRVVK